MHLARERTIITYLEGKSCTKLLMHASSAVAVLTTAPFPALPKAMTNSKSTLTNASNAAHALTLALLLRL